MPSSMTSPRASVKRASVARRGLGSLPLTSTAMRATAGPDMRTIPMPPRPAGVATAAIVSRARSSLRMGRFVAVEHALDLPLLQDGKDVVHQPVEHQAGWEEEKEDAEYIGHVLHDLRLDRVRRHGIELGLDHHRERHQDRQNEVRIERREVFDPKH